MAYSDASDPQRDSYYDIHEWNLDKSVKPHVMVRGGMGKDSGGTWRYLRVSASGAISNDDAANFRISSIGGTTSPLSADSSNISAIQGDAGKLRVSSIQGDAGLNLISAKQGDAANLMMSAKSGDAGTFRISAIGGTAGDNTIVDGVDQSVSARIKQISAVLSASDNAMIVHAVSEGAGRMQVSAKSGDAGLLRISSVQGDAGLQLVSAKQGDAALLRISGIQGDGANLRISAIQDGATALNISAKSNDGGLLRTSALVFDGEYSAGPNVVVSARGITVASAMKGLVVAAVMSDAAFARISAIGTLTVSSHEIKQSDAASLRISAISVDATNLVVSAVQQSANLLRISATADNATLLNISAKSDSAALFRISAFAATATNLPVSATQADAGLLRVSSMGADAGNDRTSALQADAGLLRISARIFGDTTGNWTVYRTLNASASQAVKATAGAVYGYYLGNSDTKFNYLKFYNTSGAINVGTDTPILTVPIPPSAAANIEFTGGLKGFTNGIGIAALSAVADNATTASPASAVNANIFYI